MCSAAGPGSFITSERCAVTYKTCTGCVPWHGGPLLTPDFLLNWSLKTGETKARCRCCSYESIRVPNPIIVITWEHGCLARDMMLRNIICMEVEAVFSARRQLGLLLCFADCTRQWRETARKDTPREVLTRRSMEASIIRWSAKVTFYWRNILAAKRKTSLPRIWPKFQCLECSSEKLFCSCHRHTQRYQTCSTTCLDSLKCGLIERWNATETLDMDTLLIRATEQAQWAVSLRTQQASVPFVDIFGKIGSGTGTVRLAFSGAKFGSFSTFAMRSFHQ